MSEYIFQKLFFKNYFSKIIFKTILQKLFFKNYFSKT